MAKDAFDFAIAINPNFYSAYLNKADVFVLMNDFGNAVALLNDIIERDPENLKAICALADCYQEMEEYKIAVDKYDKVLSIFSGYSDALFGKAVVLYKLKKFGQAVASIKQALEIEPDNPDYWLFWQKSIPGKRNSMQLWKLIKRRYRSTSRS
jgi:tetratricopeptide (TPR) repeat protein